MKYRAKVKKLGVSNFKLLNYEQYQSFKSICNVFHDNFNLLM